MCGDLAGTLGGGGGLKAWGEEGRSNLENTVKLEKRGGSWGKWCGKKRKWLKRGAGRVGVFGRK